MMATHEYYYISLSNSAHICAPSIQDVLYTTKAQIF